MEHILSIFTDKANLLGAVVVAVMTGVFGAHWQVFALFAALNVIDFFYGWLKGKQTGTINSAKGAVGIMKKVSYWVVIAIAFGVAQVLIDFGEQIGAQLYFLEFIGWFTLGVYILNELTSCCIYGFTSGVQTSHKDFRHLISKHNQIFNEGDKVIPKEDK